MQKIKIIILIILALMITSCGSPGTYMGPSDMRKPLKSANGLLYPEFIPIGPDLFANNSFHEYRVGPQDILTVIVWNHPELTIPSMQTTSESVNIFRNTNDSTNNPTGILINEKGEIFFPLAGRFQVSGLTVDEIRVKLTERLIKYIRNPQVSVRVSAFRNKPIYILGEVTKPGVLTITDMPMTIMDAINQAGGIDRETSDTSYIYIIRGNINKPQVFWLDASTPGAMLMAESFQLQSRDVLIVSTAGVVRWSRVMNRLIPTIQTFMNPPINMRTDN